jgi:hypothetical protein
MWLLDYIYISLLLGLFIIIYLAIGLPLYAIDWIEYRLKHG